MKRLLTNSTAISIVIVVIFMLALNAILGFVLSSQSKTAMKTLIQNRMLDISKTAADMLDGDILKSLKAEDTNSSRTHKVKAWWDMHSHFLPGMDDGCQTAEESIRLLEYARKRGVVGMIATPHYYPEESIEEFLHRRQEAAQNLTNLIREGGFSWFRCPGDRAGCRGRLSRHRQ